MIVNPASHRGSLVQHGLIATLFVKLVQGYLIIIVIGWIVDLLVPFRNSLIALGGRIGQLASIISVYFTRQGCHSRILSSVSADGS